MERFTNAFFIAAMGAFAIFAAVIVVNIAAGGDDEPRRSAAIADQKATLDAMERAERKKAARKRAAKREARDRRRSSAVEKTWNDDPFLGRRASNVSVRGSTIKVTTTEGDQWDLAAVSGLCRKTLEDHRWLTRVRVFTGNGTAVMSAVRGESSCSAGDGAKTRSPASKPAPMAEPEPAPSGDELAVQSFNAFVRRHAPKAPWDYVLDDVYMTGVFTSTLTLEINDPTVAEVMCRAARAWIDDTNYRFAEKAKVYTAVSQGRRELAEC